MASLLPVAYNYVPMFLITSFMYSLAPRGVSAPKSLNCSLCSMYSSIRLDIKGLASDSAFSRNLSFSRFRRVSSGSNPASLWRLSLPNSRFLRYMIRSALFSSASSRFLFAFDRRLNWKPAYSISDLMSDWYNFVTVLASNCQLLCRPN